MPPTTIRAPWLTRLAAESGLTAIITSPRDTKILCLHRLIRLYAYGATFLILAQFLSSLNITDARIGLFMTFTLLGDVIVSFVLTTITDQVGRRRILAIGAALMGLSGLVFATTSSYWLLVLASVLGVISPSGNEIGPFRAVEESILAHLTDRERRTDVFAWYTLMGTAGAALGAITSGWTVQVLQSRTGWTEDGAYRVIFVIYASIGVIKLMLVSLLSPAVEVERRKTSEEGGSQGSEGERLLSDGNPSHEQESTPANTQTAAPANETRLSLVSNVSLMTHLRSLLPNISSASRSMLYRLILLLILDSFASGMATPSWLSYFFTAVHSLQPSTLGTLFFVTNLLASISNIIAVPLARRLGPLKTMVLTHLPSALCLAVVPLPPATALGTWLATGLLALRACTQSMDQAPRQAFLAAAVLPEERTAVLGVVNIFKTMAQAGGVGASGMLAEKGLWVVMLGGAGLMKGAYDLLMLWLFLGLPER